MAEYFMSGANPSIVHDDPSAIIVREVRENGLEFFEGSQLRWPERDPGHPRYWSFWTKVFNTALVITLDVITTIISTSGAGASIQGRVELNLGDATSTLAFTSIYCFGQAIGGLICPPISESYGRKHLYVWSTFLYSAFCVLVGASMNIYWVIPGRFFSGLVSSIPTLVVAGSIEDMHNSEARIWMIFAWGMVRSSLYTFVTEALNWRWVFWIASIVTFCLGVTTLFLKESRPSQILKARLSRLNKATTSGRTYTVDDPDEVFSIHNFVADSLTRPVRLFFTEPIVFLVTILSAMAVGQIYLLTEAMSFIYKMAPLSLSDKQCSLAFIPIAIGLVLNVIPRFYDHWRLRRIKARGAIPTPEDKIHGFGVAAPLLAIGFWWFAWTIPPAVPAPWFVSFLPLIFVGFATNEFDCILVGYMTDLYTTYCASAIGSLGFLRSFLSGVLPLVTIQIYRALEANIATSILAGISTLFCAVPVLFLKYGPWLRERSEFAKFSHDAVVKMQTGSRSGILEGTQADSGDVLNSEDTREMIVIVGAETAEMWLWRNFYLK